MAELIQKQDTLNEGRVKINAAITDAEQAKVTAGDADSKATQALANSESTQTQLDTIVINGDSSVEAAQARVDEKGVGHTTLKDRIDDGFTKVTSQLNETDSELSNVIEKVNGIDKAIGGTFETLDELISTHPNGNDKRYVVTEDGNWYYWDGEWKSGGIFQGIGISEKSITYKETNFAKKGKNLFDGNFVHGLIMTGSPQTGGEVAERDSGISLIIKLVKGETYTASVSEDADRFATAAFANYPHTGQIDAQARYISAVHSSRERTFTLEGDEEWVMFYVSSPTQNKEPLWFQIERGPKRTAYEPYNAVKLALTENSISDYEIAPKSIKPYHLDFGIEGGAFINIEQYGASVTSADNRESIQSAIDSASNSGGGVVWIPEGEYNVNGTIYMKSNVTLDGKGIIKAINNSNFDEVSWGGNAVPSKAKTLLSIVGTGSNPIENAVVRGITVNYNGENQNVEVAGSYIGIAMAHTKECVLENVNSLNVMYEKTEVIENDDKVRSICLFVALSKGTKIIGGRYWKAGYDSIRIAGGAENTSLINVKAGMAKRGSIQVTPFSNIIHMTNCTFDNVDGGHSTSHAFFAHNLKNVYAEGLSLYSKDGYCIAIFSDGNESREATSKYANFKNVTMKNDEERFISLTSIKDEHWTNNISIQGIALTSKKTTPVSGFVPIYVNRCSDISLDLIIPEISANPISLQQVKNINLRADVKTNHSIYTVVGLTGNLGVRNVKIHDSIIDAPNAQRTVNSNGTSDLVKITDVKTNTIDSVAFKETDNNIIVRDVDFREVQNGDKMRLVETESVTIDNLIA